MKALVVREMKRVWVRAREHSNSGQLGMAPFILGASTDVRAHSVPTGRVIFEIGGTPVREELAREGRQLSRRSGNLVLRYTSPALRLAGNKLPSTTEFITCSTPPRLGSKLLYPPTPGSEVTTILEAHADATQ
jgi:ribosomal protein L16/L10AE